MQPLTTTSREKYSFHNHNVSTPQSVTSSIVIPSEIQVSSVLFTLRWRLMTQILLALPVLGLFVCLISSLIFHADHINNTICEVSKSYFGNIFFFLCLKICCEYNSIIIILCSLLI